jgi:hypothetical protein
VNYSVVTPTFTVAERLNIKKIATLDGLDFSIVRPHHVEHFTLLP